MGLESFFRAPALSEIKTRLLLAKIQEIVSEVVGLRTEWRFYVQANAPFTSDEKERLTWLLSETFEQDRFAGTSMFDSDGISLEVGPRPAIVTPWSSNAVSICHACGLDKVTRIERAWRYRLITKPGASISPLQIKQIYQILYDRMTEQPYQEPLETFDPDIQPELLRTVPLIEEGIAALQRFAKEMGLALWEVMQEYIHDYYVNNLGRNPTDVEIFKFGQLNSEHCRHHLFNGEFVIDGQRMPKSLFRMIKDTMKAHPGNVVIAYDDNAAILAPLPVRAFVPTNPTVSSAFRLRSIDYGIIAKVETHNHPTGICAFPGAATGTGGEIRDRQGAGRGGIPVAGLACYYVGNLLIPGYELAWEKEFAPHPPALQIPLEIIIEASDGASDYGNKFGQPLVLGSYTAFEQMVDGEHYGWKKPCMVAGGTGLMDGRHAEKLEPKKGHTIVQIGGDGYWIGLGGGSGSSQDSGAQSEDLDFDSVQRDNAEMENRTNAVIRACSELGDDSPIVTITDLGAGGECVALTEIAFPAGAHYELREIPCGDTTMPPYVIWCNESQERLVMVVWHEQVETLRKICHRNRCPMYVVGEITGDGKLLLTDRNAPDDAPREEKCPVDVGMDFLLADLPEVTIDCSRTTRSLNTFELPGDVTVRDALDRVLRVPKVASKDFLTRKVDRSVTGLVAQQQTVGPLQLTLADCAVTANSFFETTGTAKALGEQPIKGLIDHRAGARMSVGESLSNIVWALIDGFESINFSGTWQWPCKQPGEDVRLYEAVEAATELCKELKLRIPVGKDSVSMTAYTKKNGKRHAIKSPGTVQFFSFAPCVDITKTVTPDIKAPGQSKLIFIDLAPGKRRLGGSALAQAYNQIGDTVADVEDFSLLRRAFEAIQEMIRNDLILAGHDRSDGGLITCILEMAFTGNCGLEIDFGNPKIWGKDSIELLFNEELGLTIEYLPENENAISEILRCYELEECTNEIGRTVRGESISIKHNGERILSAQMPELRAIWRETSFQLDQLQANPEVVAAERKNTYTRTGPHYNLTYTPEKTPASILEKSEKPKVAILREEGTNGDREMAGAFHSAGFEAWDVHMTDLVDGRVTLKDFKGIAFPGGFSFADVMDAGKGWAGVFRFNQRVSDEFAAFVAREETFVFGVCNGCQLMALLGIVPYQGISNDLQPRFIHNRSEIFESRLISVKIEPSDSIFLKEMDGSVLGVWVNHAEGRFHSPNQEMIDEIIGEQLAPIRYVTDEGDVTEDYPFNPNGSPRAIAGLSSRNGRFLAIMPHPERLFLPWQFPYLPPEWKTLNASPWLKLFQNARAWCDNS